MLTEKVSRFLDYDLKPIMQNGNSYIRDSGHFIEKIRNINNLLENAILVTVDVMGLYPSIPYQAGSGALKEALENRSLKKNPKNGCIWKIVCLGLITKSFSKYPERLYRYKVRTPLKMHLHG